MKFNFKQSAIMEAVSNACNVIPNKSTMPIIRNLKIEAKEDELTIFATDSEIELTIKVKDNIKIEQEGSVFLDGNRFKKILQEIGEGDYELEQNGNLIYLRGIGCEFSLNTVNGDEYPEFDGFEGESSFSIPGISLKSMFEKTIFATRDEPSRYQMNGILINGSGDSFDVVSTDTKRLALVQRKIAQAMKMEELNCILSTRFVSTLMKTVDDTNVEVKIEGNRIKIKSSNMTLNSKLVNGIFPDYRKAIPACDFKLVANRLELLSAIRKATIFTSEITKSIKFSFQNNMILLHSSMPEFGEAHISVEVKYEGEPIEMNFNASYFIEGLNVINNEEITLELKDDKRPAILKGDEDYLYLVMPVLSKD